MKLIAYLKKILVFTIMAVILSVTMSCSPVIENNTTLFLGKFLQLNLYMGNESGNNGSVELCENEIKSFLKEFEEKISVNIEGSQVSLFNTANKDEVVALNTHVYNVFEKALKYAEETNGAFNPCMFDLSNLWGFTPDSDNFGTIPSQTDIESKLELAKFDKIELNEEEKTVKKTADGVKVDFGGIAKGYALNICREIAQKHNIKGGTINIAGNIYAIGKYTKNNEDRKYKIGITDPRAMQNNEQFFSLIHLQESSVSVSGDYERYFLKEGIRYSHILDPQTGCPVNNNIFSVVIVDTDAAKADAFSTTVMVSGLQNGVKMMTDNALNGVIITKDSYYVFGDIELSEVNTKVYKYET